jgi:DNA polymerase (family 10)
VEIIDFLEYVIPFPKEKIKTLLQQNQSFALVDEKEDCLFYKPESISLRVCLYSCALENLTKKIFDTTGTAAFTCAFHEAFPESNFSGTEADIFVKNNIQYIPAYLREQEAIIGLAKNNKIPACIETTDIKGIIHSHSNWSDGTNTIEEMVLGCIEKGYEYLVISDHSKSAFYANGLQEQRIKEQHNYIDTLNYKYAPFKVFKSIESDILNDGSLDYNENILSTFDLVIASVHSNLKMTQEKAMSRLLAAIENPYTTILGHMTGRLLLSRPPYPVDYNQIIEACYDNNVVIELNAHPSRLDIDWRQIENVWKNDVLISINPDAHSIEGYADIRYGVLAAQKGMVQAKQNLSSFSLQDFEAYLFEIRERKGS